MKKTLAIALALLMCFSLFAQGAGEAPAEKKATKIGFVVIGSENDQGYTYNFMNGMNAAMDKLKADGYDVVLSVKRDINEDAGCVDANLSLDKEQNVELSLEGIAAKPKSVSGKILSCKAITDYNDFEHPDRVVPAEFKGAKLSKQTVTVKVPAKSIAVIRIK